MKVKKGDTVKVTTGKDKGKVGEVIRVYTKRGKIVVKGVNIVTKHVRKSFNRPGEIIKYEAPIQASNVLVKCPGSDNFTRVSYTFNDQGKKIRYSTKFKEALDIPFEKKSK